jgi:DNA (cytosine-5)-methyltransferase 1
MKIRRMKVSDRGIYIQDKELKDTNFKVGEHYRYIIDAKSKKMFIIGSDNENDNTVSKRATKTGEVKPVLDIRSKRVKEAFKGADYLQVTIKNNMVTVEAYVNEESSFIDKAVSFVKKLKNKAKKIVDISELIKVRKTAEVVMSVKDLNKAVGYEQVTFNFDEILSKVSTSSTTATRGIRNKLKNIDIPLKVVSLFSGAGLLDMGFKKAGGFEIVAALELSENACLTYAKNIGEHVICADITKYDLKSLPKSELVIGGSPCCRYSNSNRVSNLNKQLHEADRILDIPDNILLRKYIEAVKSNDECIVFIHENVGQVNTIGEGRLIEEIKEELPDFEITTGVLNSVDFGAAQSRKRSVIFGSKIGKIDLPKPGLHEVQTVRKSLEGLTENTPNQKDFSKPKPLTLERMKFVPQGGNVKDIPEEIRPSGEHSDYFKRLEWDKPSITIVNPRKAQILHPEENRILSVRECARIQGLEDSFIFYGDLASKQLMVANGVPINLGYALAMRVKEYIIEHFDIKEKQLALSI